MYLSLSTNVEASDGGIVFMVAQALELDWVQVHPKMMLFASPDGSREEFEPRHPGDTATPGDVAVVLALLLSAILALRASDPFFLLEGGMAGE